MSGLTPALHFDFTKLLRCDVSDFFTFSAEGNPPAQITWWINATHKVSSTHHHRHHFYYQYHLNCFKGIKNINIIKILETSSHPLPLS